MELWQIGQYVKEVLDHVKTRQQVQLDRIEEKVNTIMAGQKELDDAIAAEEAEETQFESDIKSELSSLQVKADAANVDLGPEVARIQALVARQVAADPSTVVVPPPTTDAGAAA